MEKLSSVSRTFDLNALSVSTIVCGISSWFTHRTVVPGAIVISAGANVKLSMLISIVGGTTDGRLLRARCGR